MTTSRISRIFALNLLLGSLCLTPVASAAESGTQPAGALPKIGDKPPLLQAKGLLQAPPGVKLDAESLRGKVVVLEFWGTWCGACLMAIPHMNEVADALKDQPVQFVATYEGESKVAPFLNKRPIKGWVALDTDKAMASAYGVQAWPHTVILGRDGRIAAITYPGELQEQHLRDLIAGKKISLPVHDPLRDGERPEQDPDEKSAVPPLFQVLVRPSTQPGGSVISNYNSVTLRGMTVRNALPTAFDCTEARMQIDATLPEGKYDLIVAQSKGSREDKNTLMQTALRSAFGITGKRVTKEVDVLVLRVAKQNAPGLVVSPSEFGGMNSNLGSMTCVAQPLSTATRGLESRLGTPVVDETGLKEKYDLTLRWPQKPGPVDREALFKALREQLGLELVPAKRQVEMLVVEGPQAAAPRPVSAPAAQAKAPAVAGKMQ